MKKMIILIFIMTLPGLAYAQFKMGNQVIAHGPVEAENGTFRIRGTIGETLIGEASNDLFTLKHGFWNLNLNFIPADTVPPVIITKDAALELDENGNASITVEDIDNGSFDNVGIAYFELDKYSFTCDDVGGNTVTLTAYDFAGNFSSGTAAVNVSDNLPPVPDPSCFVLKHNYYLDENGQVIIDPAGICIFTDNCGVESYSLSKTVFDCSDLYIDGQMDQREPVVFTGTDVNGNTYSSNFNYYIYDDIPPTIVTKDITVELDHKGGASVSTEDVDNGSYDNCDVHLLQKMIAYDCSDIGTNIFDVSGSDARGNSSSGTAIVTVVDNLPPVISGMPANITAYTGENATSCSTAVSWTAPEATDNCGMVSLTSDHSPGDNFPVGTTTVNYIATDVNGNESTGSFDVTVIDNSDPVISVSASPDILWPPDRQMTSVTATVTVTDNCGTTTWELISITSNEDISGDVSGALYNTTDTEYQLRAWREGQGDGRYYYITYKATDPSGNETEATANVVCPKHPKEGAEFSYYTESGISLRVQPNPFESRLSISYRLENEGYAVVEVYNLLGEKITQLTGEYLKPGEYDTEWNGLTENNTELPNGVYIIRLRQGSSVIDAKVILNK